MNKGFTLIELLVVIAIIGILSIGVFTILDNARQQARDANRISDVQQIQKALDIYYINNDAYPRTSWICSYHSHWQSGILGTALNKYLPILPEDPINDSSGPYSNSNAFSYCYYSTDHGMPEDGDWYMIVFNLENANDSIDAKDGVDDCEGDSFDYGGNDGHRITYGRSCS